MSQDYSMISQTLTAFGLTDLEAEIYCYLVENSPATPYRIARDLGKPVANTYKAVQTLERKSLVMVDETNARRCRAADPSEVLRMFQQSFAGSLEQASQALAGLRSAPTGEGIFSLGGVEQVFERCEMLVEASETVILVDAYPGVVSRLAPALEAAAKRGVKVVLQCYEKIDLKRVEAIEFAAPNDLMSRWNGRWLILVVDGADYVFAFLNADGRSVANAIWCNSAFLALPQHFNLAMAMRSALVERLLENGATIDEIRRSLKRSSNWLTLAERGYRDLSQRFGTSQIESRTHRRRKIDA